MADLEHLKNLKQGVKLFNEWREINPDIKPNLSETDLRETDLCKVDLSDADLSGAVLTKASIDQVNFSRANLSGADLCQCKTFLWVNLREADLSGADLRGAILNNARLSEANLRGTMLLSSSFLFADISRADLRGADLYKASLPGANLGGTLLNNARFSEANLRGADFSNASVSGANFSRADLSDASISGADLSGTDLKDAILRGADLRGAILSRANLSGADLSGADLSGADLSGVDLSAAILVGTNFNEADLTGSRIYGISAWDLVLDNTTQTGLIITKEGDPAVTVNDIEVAQFIYFMLENKKIRRVIDALTSKAVLILGRFTKKRKEILVALRDKLSEMDYLPIIFDFEKPTDRDFTETVLTLACLSKFVIIDLTDPSSSPHEAKTTMPDLEIPFQPIIQKGQREYAMFKNLSKYPWVLKGRTYKNRNDLIEKIEKLTEAAEAKYLEIRSQKNDTSSGFTPL